MEKETTVGLGSIFKFDNQANYQQWRFQIKCALKAKGLIKYIDDKYVAPTVGSGEPSVSEEALVVQEKEDAAAMFLLTSALTFGQIVLIENCKTAKEVIQKLDSIYAKKSEFNKMMLHERFHKYQMNEKDNMAEHISKVQSIARQITESGDKISEMLVMTKIIGTLPSRYKGFRQAWLSLEESKQNIDNLTARLLDEEDNLRNVNEPSQSVALATSAKFERKEPPTCFYCKKKGHIARDCYARKRNQKQKESYDSNHSAFVSYHSAFVMNKYDTDDRDVWLLDSGASAHMTFQKEIFYEFYECQSNSVRLGDNTQLCVKGIGNIKIQKLLNNTWYDSELKDVLYIPTLQRNLISEGVLTEKGYRVVKEGCKAVIIDSNGQLAAFAQKQHNKLYKLMFKAKMALNINVTTQSNNFQLWHERLGHINKHYLKEMVDKNLVNGVIITNFNDFFCEACTYGKQHKLPFQKEDQRRECKPGEIIYSDVCGPISTESISGYKYFVLFKDACTAYRVIFFMRHKNETLECFKEYLRMCRNKFGQSIKILHCDNGGEYCNTDFKDFLTNFGITLETTAPYTPEQNARAERDFRTIMECARSMIHRAKAPLNLWAEAVNCAVYILNRTPTVQTPSATPYEKWTGDKPKLEHVKVFGCDAYMHVPDQLRSKLEAKSKKMVFVGYDGNSTNFRLLDPATKRIKVSRNVQFNESSFSNLFETSYCSGTDIKVLFDINDIPQTNFVRNPDDNTAIEQINDTQNVNQETESKNEETECFYDTEEMVNNENIINEHGRKLRPRNLIKPPDRYTANLTEAEEPSCYEDAMRNSSKVEWEEAIKSELNSLKENDTWEEAELPANKIPITSKWIFKIKRNPDGTISKYKARLVARGFDQKQGIDFFETFSPTTRYDSIRILMSLSAKHAFEIKQFDVKTAFLHGDIEEEIYMLPPQGLAISSGKVCKLKRSIYGLKQAPRCWNKKLNDFLNEINFKNIKADTCIYTGTIEKQVVILAIFVDDGILFAKNQNTLSAFLKMFQKRFEITIIDDPKCFIGLEIQRAEDGKKICIHQNSYVKNMLKRFNLTDAKSVCVPALTKISCNDEDMNQSSIPYREAVGCLIYLAITTRPDISHAVGVASRKLNNYSSEDWYNVKRIMKYLSGTVELGIEYSNDSTEVVGFSDADYAMDIESRRSTTGYIFMMGGSPITWCSRRQSSVALSTTEAEYMAVCDAAKEAMWIKQFIKEVENIDITPININSDNQSAIRLIKNPEYHKRTKHIDVRHHYIRELYENGDIAISYVRTDSQIADIFTKALSRDKFIKLRQYILK